MNRNIFDKLNSRKLWTAIVGIVVGIAAAFGLDESEWVQVAGVMTSAASVVAYHNSLAGTSLCNIITSSEHLIRYKGEVSAHPEGIVIAFHCDFVPL